MPITDTVRDILLAAAAQPDHLARLPDRLPAAARRAVVQSMLRAGLVEEREVSDPLLAWRTTEDGQRFSLRATVVGLDAIGASSPTAALAVPAGATKRRPSLRATAQAVLTAWTGSGVDCPAMADAVEALRTALTTPSHDRSSAPLQPRPETKRATIITLLRRPEGATVAQVVEVTGWARHTVHGFFAGLKKAGTPVEVLERVRQVGPGKQGAAGSYTVYRIAEAG